MKKAVLRKRIVKSGNSFAIIVPRALMDSEVLDQNQEYEVIINALFVFWTRLATYLNFFHPSQVAKVYILEVYICPNEFKSSCQAHI